MLLNFTKSHTAPLRCAHGATAPASPSGSAPADTLPHVPGLQRIPADGLVVSASPSHRPAGHALAQTLLRPFTAVASAARSVHNYPHLPLIPNYPINNKSQSASKGYVPDNGSPVTFMPYLINLFFITNPNSLTIFIICCFCSATIVSICFSPVVTCPAINFMYNLTATIRVGHFIIPPEHPGPYK